MLRCLQRNSVDKTLKDFLVKQVFIESKRSNIPWKNSSRSDANGKSSDLNKAATAPVLSASNISGTFRKKYDVVNHENGRKLALKNLWIPSPSLDSDRILNSYKKLGKFRLTSLVVITAMGGYALAPASLNLYTFTMCSVGTGLLSVAANTINQHHEVPFDSQMSRTKYRPLVTGEKTALNAIGIAIISGTSGLISLQYGVNDLTAMLGLCNLMLYTCVYTPMKRISILNTWVGSVVGAIPPLMGWAGCAGELGAGAWIMAALLYAWQFPHFNALSWNLRPDYSRAGYRMMAVTNPLLCRGVAFRYTLVICALSLLAPVMNLTNAWFALETVPLNAYFIFLAYNFKAKADSRSSRQLFRYSLIHLPLLMFLLILNKKRRPNQRDACCESTEENGDLVARTSEK